MVCRAGRKRPGYEAMDSQHDQHVVVVVVVMKNGNIVGHMLCSVSRVGAWLIPGLNSRPGLYC